VTNASYSQLSPTFFFSFNNSKFDQVSNLILPTELKSLLGVIFLEMNKFLGRKVSNYATTGAVYRDVID